MISNLLNSKKKKKKGEKYKDKVQLQNWLQAKVTTLLNIFFIGGEF